MRKVLISLLCIAALLLSACGSAAPAAPTPEPTAVPTPTPEPTPETGAAKVCILSAPAVIAVLERGTTVTITGELGDYYAVSCEAGDGYIEKLLLATEADEKFEEWTGYAQSGAVLYPDHRLVGEALAELKMNDEFTVLADLSRCYLVDLNGTLGYIAADLVSSHRIEVYYYDGGGYSGGGGGDSSAPAGGADGGDITLGYVSGAQGTVVPMSAVTKPEVTSGSKAQVIALEAELIADFFDLGDEVRVISLSGDVCKLYIDGVYASMEKRFLVLDGDSPFEEKDMYAGYDAVLYDNYYLVKNDNSVTLSLNDTIRVLADLVNCYFVRTEDGAYGYVDKASLSESRTEVYYYGGGYSGGGGDSGGGGVEWTDPVL